MVVLKTKRNDPRVSERSYRMKKVIAILLVLLVTGVVFGGPTTAELTLGATVNPFEGIKLSIGSGLDTISTWNGATSEDATLTLTAAGPDAAPSGDFYVNLRTNRAGAISVGFLGNALTADGINTEIDYEISTAGGTGFSSAGTFESVNGSETAVNVITFTADTNGARVIPALATVAMVQGSWEAALEGTYGTTVTVSITTEF